MCRKGCKAGRGPALRPVEPGRAQRLARAAGRGLLDLLLPPHCLSCDAPVADPGQLCPACFRATSFITAPFCARCGVPFAFAAQAEEGGLCPFCLDHPPEFDRARGALRYDAAAQRIVLPLKYADRTETAPALAAHMARAGAALLRDAELLVPVPLHRSRLLARRYNQTALLARALSRLSGVPCLPDALQRVRVTESLGTHSARERRALMAGVVAVRPGRAARLHGRHVLLVDDVLSAAISQ